MVLINGPLVVINDPDPRLKKISKQVESIDDSFRDFMHSLLDVMRDENGIGIAAIQVSVPIRAFIVNLHPEAPIFFMVNPEITYLSEQKVILPEGCLSVKGLNNKIQRGEVERPRDITISYSDLNNKRLELSINGDESEYHLWLARCIQHEYDHLNGILFIEKLYKGSKLVIDDEL